MKTYQIVFFGLMCVAQWYVPGAMIVAQETVLRSGKVFRFKTAPVDPSDPFRGKYITLDFESEVYKHNNDRQWERGETVFVLLRENEYGFAQISDIADSEPIDAIDFFKAEVAFSDEETVRVNFPFDRFYLEESKAFQAEKIYRERQNDSTQTAYAVVRIKNGQAVLEDVLINDRSIVDIVRELQN
ncbi:MAG TPA: GDYXXLXY domain-containing protein [Chryseosolibacter sp.]